MDWERSKEAGHSVKKEALKRLRIKEQQRQGRVARKIRKQAQDPVTKVFITRDGVKECCHTKDTVEQACIEEGLARFNQTRPTPPMQDDVTDEFGFNAEKPPVNQVLEGTYDCEKIKDPFLRLLLSYMRTLAGILKMGPLPVELTLDEHIKGWRKQKAKTGAMECQTNFSDHIAATFNEELAEIDQLIRQTPYEKGFGPEYAQVIEDFQILKKSGVIDVEGMRIIMMMLAMYNMNNKRLG